MPDIISFQDAIKRTDGKDRAVLLGRRRTKRECACQTESLTGKLAGIECPLWSLGLRLTMPLNQTNR
jgi:hypothetical protein